MSQAFRTSPRLVETYGRTVDNSTGACGYNDRVPKQPGRKADPQEEASAAEALPAEPVQPGQVAQNHAAQVAKHRPPTQLTAADAADENVVAANPQA